VVPLSDVSAPQTLSHRTKTKCHDSTDAVSLCTSGIKNTHSAALSSPRLSMDLVTGADTDFPEILS